LPEGQTARNVTTASAKVFSEVSAETPKSRPTTAWATLWRRETSESRISCSGERHRFLPPEQDLLLRREAPLPPAARPPPAAGLPLLGLLAAAEQFGARLSEQFAQGAGGHAGQGADFIVRRVQERGRSHAHDSTRMSTLIHRSIYF